MPSFEFCWTLIFSGIKLSWHSCSMWKKLGWLSWFWEFLWEGIFSFNPKGFDSYGWSCRVCKGRIFVCSGLISSKLYWFLLMFSNGFTSLSVLLLFTLPITFFAFMCLSLRPSQWLANLFWLIWWTPWTISNDLTQMVIFPTRIPYCDSHSPAYFF